MTPLRLERATWGAQALAGLVLTVDVRDAAGAIVFRKGTRLRAQDAAALEALAWDELHVVAIGPDDLEERAAGTRLARAAAGANVAVGDFGGGHWPLHAGGRGLLEVNAGVLADVNGLDGLAVCTALDGQAIDAGEAVAHVKIIPFVVASGIIARAEAIAREAGGLVSVRAFTATSVGVVVQEVLPPPALARFRDAVGAKLAWFGARLNALHVVPAATDALAAAMRSALDAGVGVLVVAGSRPMDPLDPAFEALRLIGARLERVGVPVHPGSLLWTARAGEIPVVGMPSCGLFSEATAFDLVLPRLLTGAPADGAWLAALGHGGLLSRDAAQRVPRYQTDRERGEVG